MKKFLMIAVMAAFSMVANAQWYAGGGMNLKWAGATGTSFSFSPEVGYNLNEKWAVGGALSYEYNNPVHKVTIDPYARYTFVKMGSVSFFVDGEVKLGIVSAGDTDFAVSVGVQPGMAYALNKKLTLIAKTNLFTFNHDTDNSIDVFGKTTGLEFGLYFNL